MPRPPSKHGLERKYKTWRRGKSKSAKPQTGSLKNQLRGQERLLKKLLMKPDQQTSNDSAEKLSFELRKEQLETKISELKREIQAKQASEKERHNAKESHGKRFLERQRLTRLERGTRKLLSQPDVTAEDKQRYDQELYRIALDQVYVAHYPHDTKYLTLFRNGVRMEDINRRNLVKRSMARQRILKNLGSGTMQRVNWIANDQYERIPSDWSVASEESTFSKRQVRGTADSSVHAVQDNRFALSQDQCAMVDAVSEMEKEEEAKEAEARADDQISDSSDSDTSSNNADPITGAVKRDDTQSVSSYHSSSSSDSDSDSSRDAEESPASSDSDSDSGTSRLKGSTLNGLAGEMKESYNRTSPSTGIDSEFGDFFTSVDADAAGVFTRARQEKPDLPRGDKSQGWATQRQRPGQFKKRRVRN